MSSCIFCEIVQKKSPAYIIDENDNFIAFLSIFPNTLGATVIIPKKHYSSYAFDLNDDALTQLILFSKKVAHLLDNFFEDVGRTALVFEGFGVDHVHAKLFPMHGTQQKKQKWEPIKSSVNKYFNQYEGYISSHDYELADKSLLNILATEIRSSNLNK